MFKISLLITQTKFKNGKHQLGVIQGICVNFITNYFFNKDLLYVKWLDIILNYISINMIHFSWMQTSKQTYVIVSLRHLLSKNVNSILFLHDMGRTGSYVFYQKNSTHYDHKTKNFIIYQINTIWKKYWRAV